jgi:hypothetical protein
MTCLRRAGHNTYPLLMCRAIDILPLLGAFADDILGGEVEVYRGGGEAVGVSIYSCSELITAAALLDYIPDFVLDYVRIARQSC